MYVYLLYLITYYPIIFYMLQLYKYYEYLEFVKKILEKIKYVYIKLCSKRNEKGEDSDDEIYELILKTSDDEIEVMMSDDSNYVKYNEENKIIHNQWFKSV